jgi:GntR family transcriptional regulator, trigonelline degradation regulator
MSSLAEEQAYKTIKDMILRAELLPGTRLVHRKLAKDLGMSPIPVVLALRLLEHDGLVVNVPGLGAQVRTWNRDELADLYGIRALHESHAAKLCAERATRVDLLEIEMANERYIESWNAVDLPATMRHDAEFHRAVVRGAHCDYLENLVEHLSIIQLSIAMLVLKSSLAPIPEESTPGMLHIPLVEALQKRDGGEAARQAESHVLEGLEGNLDSIAEGLELVTKTA